MRAEIISIGTELLLGTITDTNASYLAQRLAGLGIDCYYVSQVGDNLERVAEVLARAWDRSDLVVTTGGLGPTQDDLTREAISAMLGEEMVVDPELERHLLSLFTRRGLRMPVANVKQATLIPSASAISNPVGSAPGWWVTGTHAAGGERIIVSMPGVPYEMKRMWEREVESRLQSRSSSVIVSRTLKLMGLGESRVAEVVADLMAGSNPTLAPYAKSDGVHLRITAKCATPDEAHELIADVEKQVRSRLGEAIYGADDETPSGVVSKLFEEADLTFTIVEVGPGALGSLGSLLGAHPLCSGVLGARNLELAARDTGYAPSGNAEADIAAISESARHYSNSDVALAVSVQVEPIDGEDASVKFSADILFVAGEEGQETSQASYSWRATMPEVNRLVGLAALNHTRQRLLVIARQKGRVVAV